MAFVSELLPGEHVIDETNYHIHARRVPRGRHRGRIPRDYGLEVFCSGRGSRSLEEAGIPIIPREEWAERIEEKERKKTRISDHILATYQTDNPVYSLDQNGTNYCWCNAVVSAMEILRCLLGLPHVKLSAASVAAQVKQYFNQGGWGSQALDWICKHGIFRAKDWPPNYWRDSKYRTAEGVADALRRLIVEWFDLRPNRPEEKMSCVLQNIPVPSGYNWWSHETCGCDGVILSRNPLRFGFRDRNSWSDKYGTKGFFTLSLSKGTGNDQVGVRGMLPSFD